MNGELFESKPLVRGECVFSPDRIFRYVLKRTWDPDGRDPLVVIGLNPSKADEWEDDPTIRRCMSFAKREGAGGLVMLNLFAFRSTDPDVMFLAAKDVAGIDVVGPNNDFYIARETTPPRRVVVAWGNDGEKKAARGRARTLTVNLKAARARLCCFGRTTRGAPLHPLYLPGDTRLEDYA